MTSASEQPTTGTDKSVREGIMRDLYALAAYYLANPGHPLPTSIVVYHHAPLAEVEAVAADAGVHVYGDVPQCHHDLAGTRLPVSLLVSVPNPGRDRPL